MSILINNQVMHMSTLNNADFSPHLFRLSIVTLLFNLTSSIFHTLINGITTIRKLKQLKGEALLKTVA